MPIQIGEKCESGLTDPIGMLGDCHRRIVRYLQVFVVLATQQAGVSAGAVRALRANERT